MFVIVCPMFVPRFSGIIGSLLGFGSSLAMCMQGDPDPQGAASQWALVSKSVCLAA